MLQLHNNLKVSALPLQCHVAESYKINAISQTDIMQLNSAVKSFTKILIGAASYRYSTVMCVLKFMGFQFLFHFGLCNSNRHIVYGVSIPFVFRVVQQLNLNKDCSNLQSSLLMGYQFLFHFRLKFMGYQFLFHFRLCNSNRHIVYGVSIPFVFRVVQQSNLNKVISFMGISSYGSVSHRY